MLCDSRCCIAAVPLFAVAAALGEAALLLDPLSGAHCCGGCHCWPPLCPCQWRCGCCLASSPVALQLRTVGPCAAFTTTAPGPLPAVDKRLDEWVGQERVASIAKVASADGLHRVASGGGSGDLGPMSGDQKMTRRLKRQYTGAARGCWAGMQARC